MGIILALVAGIGGALVGAFLSGRIIAYAHYLNKQKLVRDREARTLLNLFQALQAELAALWTAYEALVGEELERTDKPEELAYAGVISASQHYFRVYDNTAHLLGTLEPDSDREKGAWTLTTKGLPPGSVRIDACLSDKDCEAKLPQDVQAGTTEKATWVLPGRSGHAEFREHPDGTASWVMVSEPRPRPAVPTAIRGSAKGLPTAVARKALGVALRTKLVPVPSVECDAVVEARRRVQQGDVF